MSAHSFRPLAAAVLFLSLVSPLVAQAPADKAAEMLLNNAHSAYAEKNYAAAAIRYRDFVTKYSQHKDVAAAHYGLARCLLEGPAKDYKTAIEHLEPVADKKDFPDRPSVLYYLALSQRAVGIQLEGQAAAQPAEAAKLKAEAHKRFTEAAKQYAAAMTAFTERAKDAPADVKGLPTDLDRAAQARCDLAEMQLRLQQPKEARTTVQPLLDPKAAAQSRYHKLALYYDGFASFQLQDYAAASRVLSQLTPFTDPAYGMHARYLLARIHQNDQERPEAMVDYDGVLNEYARQKALAAETLRDPSRYKNDLNEKARLDSLVRDRAPDYVQRANFYLGVMQHEDGKFGEAAAKLTAFIKDNPTSPLLPEAQLRQGICMVQLKQFAEAQKTLMQLFDKEPRLADQCLLWLGKGHVAESGDPATNKNHVEKMKAALVLLRSAVERNTTLLKTDPEAARRRGPMLLELADTLQTAHQFKDAIAAYNLILSEKLLSEREEEVQQHLIAALQLNGDYLESDKQCAAFREKFPKSTLLPAVQFRHADNAYFLALAAEKIESPGQRASESAKWTEETIKRYTLVIEKYPEFAYTSIARYGLGMAYYRKGDLEKAKELLASIPAADRSGGLALVPYQIAEIVMRTAPVKVDDAVSAGRLEEGMKEAIELLQAYIGANPNSPQTPDAFVKVGQCHARLAAVIAQPQEQQKEYASANQAYDQVLNRFRNRPAFPQAVFERAKVLAARRDVNGAINELRRFTNDPLKNDRLAPLAQIQLATLYRSQNRPQDAVTLLNQARQNYEATLLKDATRSAWVPLLQFQQGVALREAGKMAEARATFEQIVKQTPTVPEAFEAALRSGQCLKDEGQAKVNEGRKRLANAGMKADEKAAALKLLDSGNQEIRQAALFLIAQAAQAKEKQPDAPVRARMLYEAAWAFRALADQEISTARRRIIDEQWQKLRDEVAKKTPTGRRPLFVPEPDVPLAAVAVQTSEKEVRTQYRALIEEFPDLALNADARFELAELLAERGEQDEAIKLLRSALDKEPPQELTDKIRLRLGVCLMAKGDAKAALGQFKPLLQNPKGALFAEASYRAGECHMETADYPEAAKRFALFRDQGQYRNMPPLTDRALFRLGQALEKQKQWDASRQAYQQVVERFPQSPWAFDARYGMGWAHQNQNQFDQAIAQYKQVADGIATEIGAKAQLHLGLCKLAQKKYAEASKALLVVPDTYDYPHVNARALVEAARAFAENKQKNEAIKVLEDVLRDYPDSESAAAAKKHLTELKKS